MLYDGTTEPFACESDQPLTVFFSLSYQLLLICCRHKRATRQTASALERGPRSQCRLEARSGLLQLCVQRRRPVPVDEGDSGQGSLCKGKSNVCYYIVVSYLQLFHYAGRLAHRFIYGHVAVVCRLVLERPSVRVHGRLRYCLSFTATPF